MPLATNAIMIRRPVETVCSFVADGEQCPRWRTRVLDIKRVSGAGADTRYTQGA